jgi:hypothetical protein
MGDIADFFDVSRSIGDPLLLTMDGRERGH